METRVGEALCFYGLIEKRGALSGFDDRQCGQSDRYMVHNHAVRRTWGLPQIHAGDLAIWWDLEFEHKVQTDESYINPLGGGFSRPTSWSERGAWAPSDSEPGKKLYLVVVRYQDCIARPLQLIWPDDSKDPDRFSIGGTVYAHE